MDAFSKLKVDLSVIPGPYRIFGLFLLVFESLLGFWLYRAESINERIFAGSSMTLIFVIFLISALKVMRLGVSEQSIPKKIEELINSEFKDINSLKTNLENQLNKEREEVKSLIAERSKCENECQKMRTIIAYEVDVETWEKLKGRGIL